MQIADILFHIFQLTLLVFFPSIPLQLRSACQSASQASTGKSYSGSVQHSFRFYSSVS